MEINAFHIRYIKLHNYPKKPQQNASKNLNTPNS